MSTSQAAAANPIPAPADASKSWRTALLARLAKLHISENRLFLVLAVIIGALTGLAVVAFILVTERFGSRLYPVGSAAWRRLMFPIVGSISIGYLLYKYFPNARGSGVPQTKAALFAANGRITARTVLGKFFCTSATLASGIPLGREGPSVQVGAGIGSILGRFLGLPPEQVKKLIPVGAAAAIAAAFNTPMAAVIFALEEIMGDLQSTVIGAVVLASATAWVVLRVSLGNQPLFKVPRYELVGWVDYAVYPILGVVGGVVSAAFARLLLSQRAWFLRLPRNTAWFHPLAGGLMVGIMGLFVPQVLGVGYEYVGQVLNNHLAFKIMILLVVLKLFAVTTSYGSGNAGGIFGPALFLGAMTGGAVGTVAHHFFPLTTALPGAYALVGMGAVFAGVVRAPMTSVLMIFEMTQDYAVIVPLMIANMVSLYIASKLQHEPIYEALAVQDGIHLPTSPLRDSGQLQVARVMQAPSQILPASTTVQQALDRAQSTQLHTWVVTDDTGVVGVLSLQNLQQHLQSSTSSEANSETSANTPASTLADLLDPITFPHVHTDQGLDLALERMGTNHLELLPVVNRGNIHKLEGVVTLRTVLQAYGVGES